MIVYAGKSSQAMRHQICWPKDGQLPNRQSECVAEDSSVGSAQTSCVIVPYSSVSPYEQDSNHLKIQNHEEEPRICLVRRARCCSRCSARIVLGHRLTPIM